jgi:E3 ubiquitin-protein ligase HUWE1
MRNPTKNLGKLPSSHTCFNQIELPEYPSKEVLQKKLELAITGCSEIDNI